MRRTRSACGRVHRGGFTLVELLVGLALATVLAGSIMVVATQTQEIYRRTMAQVELFARLRYAFSRMETELARMVATSDLEFFVDSQMELMRNNNHWDEKEEINSPLNLAGGWAPRQQERFYNEAPQIIERTYVRRYRSGRETEHDAFEIYFRAPVTHGGQIRMANVEYRLVKAEDLVRLSGRDDVATRSYSHAVLPPVVDAEQATELSLVRIVRYMERDEQVFTRTNWNALMRTHIAEISSNVVDFRIEYYARNPYRGAAGSGTGMKAGWYTPRMDWGSEAVELPSVRTQYAGKDVFIKEFIYGTSRVQNPWDARGAAPPRGIIRRGIKLDPRNPSGRPVPPQFFVSRLLFAELGVGDTLYIWPSMDARLPFAGGAFTIKNIVNGRLQFVEPLETAGWLADKTGLRFKAAYIPMQLRLTISISDRDGRTRHRLQRIVRMATKTNV